MKLVQEAQNLGRALEYILSRPPSHVGKRLKSERELAKLLKVDRGIIQKVFDRLVEKGYLARRHGSGTYVRKVAATTRSAQTVAFGLRFSADDLFAANASTPVRKSSLPEHRQLKLAFIDCSLARGESQKRIIAGIENRVKQAGHQLKSYQPSQKNGAPINATELMQKLHAIRCDGYILWSFESPIIDDDFLKRHAPAVYVGDNARHNDCNYAPLVRIGMEDAATRALNLLVKEGYRRIGYLGLNPDGGEGWKKNAHLYEWALKSAGLSYHASAFCPLNDGEVLSAMRKMFAGRNRPEAIYVADDILLRHTARAWQKLNIVPGENLAVITHSNHGVSLPSGCDWSRMEFHPFQLGRMVVDSLLLEIQNAGEVVCSIEHLAIWRPGTTHHVP